jgi:hypothetical protein
MRFWCEADKAVSRNIVLIDISIVGIMMGLGFCLPSSQHEAAGEA